MGKEDKYLNENKEDKIDVLDKLEIEMLIKETVEYMDDDELSERAIEAAGWDKESVEKFSQTIGTGKDGAEKHGFMEKCILHMKGKKGFNKERAGGFCASIVDKAKGDTSWRKGPRE